MKAHRKCSRKRPERAREVLNVKMTIGASHRAHMTSCLGALLSGHHECAQAQTASAPRMPA
eukprot:scaffold65794_cov23-Phaeocystis_antarctica.AAC.1